MKKQLIEKFFNCQIKCDLIDIEAEVDSRKVKNNSIFFALKGKKTDGHLFISDAIKNGALLLVVEKNFQPKDLNANFIFVENTLESLQELAKFNFLFIDALTIAITGSCGKSTTKEYLSSLLESTYRVGKTIGNQNSQIGLALSLIAMKGDEEVLVLEMGMSEKGNIKNLINIAAPNIAILTNIATNHIEQFGSKEGIAEEKSNIFTSTKLKKSYIESSAFDFESVKKKVTSEKIVYSLKEYLVNESLIIKDFIFPLNLCEFNQEHLIKNLIPAIIVAKDLGITNEQILQKIDHLKTLEHRFQIIKKKCLIIDDSYNSSLESLSLAIETLNKKYIQGKKIAIIGALAEQGIFEEIHHQKMGQILQGNFDLVYCIGDPVITTVKYLKSQNENAIYMQSIKEIAENINQQIQSNDLVFLKGANRYRLWELIDLIQQ